MEKLKELPIKLSAEGKPILTDDTPPPPPPEPKDPPPGKPTGG